MSKKIEQSELTPTDVDPVVNTTPEPAPVNPETLPNPVLDRRQAYRVARERIIDTSLDEGEKLHREGCIRRGNSPSHFVFTGKNETKTRHDIHVAFEDQWEHNLWSALLCSCPTGRHAGDPCWHKGAVRAYLADNQHIRHANALLSLPLV
jgi:hypothetical protein